MSRGPLTSRRDGRPIIYPPSGTLTELTAAELGTYVWNFDWYNTYFNFRRDHAEGDNLLAINYRHVFPKYQQIKSVNSIKNKLCEVRKTLDKLVDLNAAKIAEMIQGAAILNWGVPGLDPQQLQAQLQAQPFPPDAQQQFLQQQRDNQHVHYYYQRSVLARYQQDVQAYIEDQAAAACIPSGQLQQQSQPHHRQGEQQQQIQQLQQQYQQLQQQLQQLQQQQQHQQPQQIEPNSFNPASYIPAASASISNPAPSNPVASTQNISTIHQFNDHPNHVHPQQQPSAPQSNPRQNRRQTTTAGELRGDPGRPGALQQARQSTSRQTATNPTAANNDTEAPTTTANTDTNTPGAVFAPPGLILSNGNRLSETAANDNPYATSRNPPTRQHGRSQTLATIGRASTSNHSRPYRPLPDLGSPTPAEEEVVYEGGNNFVQEPESHALVAEEESRSRTLIAGARKKMSKNNGLAKCNSDNEGDILTRVGRPISISPPLTYRQTVGQQDPGPPSENEGAQPSTLTNPTVPVQPVSEANQEEENSNPSSSTRNLISETPSPRPTSPPAPPILAAANTLTRLANAVHTPSLTSVSDSSDSSPSPDVQVSQSLPVQQAPDGVQRVIDDMQRGLNGYREMFGIHRGVEEQGGNDDEDDE